MKQNTYDAIFKVVHQLLAHGLIFGLSLTPFLVLFTGVASPSQYWPTLLVVALIVGPVLAGIFHSLHHTKTTGEHRPWFGFWQGMRKYWWPSLRAWFLACAFAGVLVADIVYLADTSIGALFTPLMVVLTVILIPTVLHTLNLVADGHGLVASMKAAIYLSLRRPVATLVMLIILGLWAAVVLVSPIVGIYLTGGAALMAVWAQASAATTAALATAN